MCPTSGGEVCSVGLAAEAAERGRTEAAFRALETHAKEQGGHLARLEAELGARPAARPPSPSLATGGGAVAEKRTASVAVHGDASAT